MKVFEILKNIFSKTQNDIYALLDLRSAVNIPSRESLSLEENKKIDEIKLEYLKLLNNKILFSRDLDIKEIKEEVDMNAELIKNLFTKDEVYPFDYIDENEKVNLVVKASKMNLYLSHIVMMYRKVELMFIALEEILNSDKIKLPSKRRAVRFKCENLLFTLATFRNQGEGIALEVSSYLKEYNISEDVISGEEKNIKKNEVLRCIKTVMPERLDYLHFNSIKFDSPLEYVAYLERELEIYVYNNKEKKTELIRDLIYYEDEAYSYEEAVKVLSVLEMRMKIFSLYGKGIITELMINKLYEFKYELLTFNIMLGGNGFGRLNYAEVECYDKIIMEKIEDIVRGRNYVLNEFVGNNSFKMVANLFRNKDGIFSSYDILNNKKLFAFLNSLDYRENLSRVIDFFNDFMVNISDYEIPENSAFTWEEKVPLITVMKLMECGYLSQNDEIYSFYELVKDKIENIYICKIPEGISEINVGLDIITKDEKLINMINSKAKDKKVYTPSTLKSIIGFFNIDCESLILNDGCEVFSPMCFSCNSEFKISVPSSLKILHLGEFKDTIDSIIFRDYKNSCILNDEGNLNHLLCTLFLKRNVFGLDFIDVESMPADVVKKFNSLEFESDEEYFYIKSYEFDDVISWPKKMPVREVWALRRLYKKLEGIINERASGYNVYSKKM